MKSADQYFDDGNKKIFLSDYCGALIAFTNAVALDPNLKSAFINRGFVKNKLNDINGEIEDYSSVLKIDPFDELALSNRGISRILSDDFWGAIDDLNRLIMLNPEDAKAYYYRAIARDKVSDDNFKEFIGSVLDIIKAFELNHSLQIAESSRKLLSDRMIRYIQIIQKYTREIDAWLNIEDALLNRADLKEHATDYVGAIADFTKVIEINPFNDKAFLKRGYIHFMFQKDYTKAMKDFDKALEIRPFDEEFLDMRACLKFELGDYHGSLENLNQIIEQYDALDPESKMCVESFYEDAIQDSEYIKSIMKDQNNVFNN